MTRPIAITATVLAALAVAGATSGPAGAGGAKPKTHKATVGAGYYAPGKLTIRTGDKVRWTWKTGGFDLHDITVDRGPEQFKSPLRASGSYTRKFKKAGTFLLVCTQHGDMGMKLVVKKRR